MHSNPKQSTAKQRSFILGSLRLVGCLFIRIILSSLLMAASKQAESKSSAEKAAAIAQAIADRQKYKATLKTLQDPSAKFRSYAPADNERRRVRMAVRKHRSTKRLTGATKPSAANPSAASKKTHDAKTITKASRHIPCNNCGRRKAKCGCFTKGQGLEITQSFKYIVPTNSTAD